MLEKKIKVAFIHGRPSGHPTHAEYAKSVNSSFFHEDRILRWQDLNVPKVRRYTSWLLNAVFFENKNKWDVYLTECVRVPQLIQKKLCLTKSTQKLIALMDDESLYFTYSKRYPKLTRWLMVSFVKSADALICVGDYQTELALKILPQQLHNKVYTTFNGVSSKRIEELKQIKPNLDSTNIVFIGHASSWWRVQYKGLDLMLDSFVQALNVFPSLTFTIIGDIPLELRNRLLSPYEIKYQKQIYFKGRVSDISKELENTALYLHCARGEAWGISVTEALFAGIPTIISNQTGAKQVVKMLGEEFILDINSKIISEAIIKYFSYTLKEKQTLSEKARLIVDGFTEENAIKKFQETFYLIMK